MAFDAARFRELCRDGKPALGRPLMYLPVTGSTNDNALLAARSGAPHGSLFVADEQTAGRGRRGHRWLAAPGESLLYSVLVRPNLALAQASALTLAVGLSLCDAVSPLISAPVRLKWPNDLLVGQQKLAGVLVESQMQGEALKAVVIGVGLNVSTQAFPAEIAQQATSLSLLGATSLEREPLLFGLLDALSMRLAEFERSGVGGIVDELNERDALRGERLRVDALSGVARGIDAHGHLLLEDARGQTHAIASGTVERL